jgi:hypothetical protein
VTGRIVTVSKDEVAYETDDGRRLPIWIEHGTAVIVQGTPGRWDDGAEATDSELQAAQEALEREAQRRGWGLDVGTGLVRGARIRRLAEGVEALGAGRVRDRPTGAELELVGGAAVRYRLGRRTADLTVTLDAAAMTVTLPDSVQWDDGEPMSAADRSGAMQAVGRAGAWWGWWSGNDEEGRTR